MRSTPVFLAVLVLAACRQAETPDQASARIQAESDSAKTEFEAIMTAYGRYFTAGHADSLVSFYAEQAHVMPPNSRQVQGRDAVRQMYATMFQGGSPGALRFHVDDVTANGPVAVLRASWTFAPPAGAPMPADTGAGMGVWRKIDGHWLIMEEIWRSDLPVPTPAPPHRRG